MINKDKITTGLRSFIGFPDKSWVNIIDSYFEKFSSVEEHLENKSVDGAYQELIEIKRSLDADLYRCSDIIEQHTNRNIIDYVQSHYFESLKVPISSEGSSDVTDISIPYSQFSSLNSNLTDLSQKTMHYLGEINKLQNEAFDEIDLEVLTNVESGSEPSLFLPNAKIIVPQGNDGMTYIMDLKSRNYGSCKTEHIYLKSMFPTEYHSMEEAIEGSEIKQDNGIFTLALAKNANNYPIKSTAAKLIIQKYDNGINSTESRPRDYSFQANIPSIFFGFS